MTNTSVIAALVLLLALAFRFPQIPFEASAAIVVVCSLVALHAFVRMCGLALKQRREKRADIARMAAWYVEQDEQDAGRAAHS